jgi:hypothetical protein
MLTSNGKKWPNLLVIIFAKRNITGVNGFGAFPASVARFFHVTTIPVASFISDDGH